MRNGMFGLTLATLLAGCGGNENALPFGATEPTGPVTVEPAQPLVIPPRLTLPPPGGANLAERPYTG